MKSRSDMGEGDEIGKVKIKEKWFWKQKEDETKMNYEVGENNDENDKGVLELIFKIR